MKENNIHGTYGTREEIKKENLEEGIPWNP
jgi:hypothetical protein